MQLSERFLNLVHQQLNSYEAEAEIEHLVVYVAQSREGLDPSLEPIGEYPLGEKVLPPVESDPELRAPSSDRRWYPLQDGSLLLGALRVERYGSDQDWSNPLDQRLQATAAALAQCLGLEIDRRKLLNEITQQREQVNLMVHQLRNPLAALRTYAQLLLRKLGPESNHLNLVEGLLSEQDQLNRYISALDDLSQAKLPLQKNNISPLLLPPVLSENVNLNIRSLLDPLIDRASVTANVQGRKWFSPSHWPTWSDQSRPVEDGVIAEIVANLLENAFRYSSEGSSIGLWLTEKGLCVWDGGLPIPLNERERIFEKGVRGENSLKSSGSGIGLALGRQLAEDLGGSLQLIIPPKEFDPALPSEGNAFVISLSGI